MKKIFKLCLDGYGTQMIANYLFAEKIKIHQHIWDMFAELRVIKIHIYGLLKQSPVFYQDKNIVAIQLTLRHKEKVV